jgi:tetratricopeptide (TPR) repeat protein
MPVPAGNFRLAAGLLRQAGTQLLHRLAPRLFLGRARAPEQQLRNADTLFQLVPVYFIVTNMGRFLYAALRGLNRAESAFGELEARKLVAEGYGDLAIVTGGLGWRRVANAYRERAEALGRQIGDARTLARVHQSNSLYSLGAADCEIAEKALLEGRGLLRGMLGERRRYEEISGMHAWLGTLQARYERAIEIWHDIYEGAVRRGDRQSQAVALAGRSEHVFMLGRSGYLGDCEQCLWQARELLPERNDRLFDIHFHGLMAAIRLRRGSPSDARVDLDRAAAIAGESRVMLGYGMVVYARVPELYLEMAEAELTRSGQRELRDAGRRALRTLRRFVASWPAGQPRLSRCEGLLARLDGNPSRAARAFERSLEQAQRFGMPLDEGRALFELGRLDPTGGRASLEQARELFSRLGTRYEHDLATNALSRLPVP